MTKATIAIIGLGKIGSSIGLALKAPEFDYQIVGHDKDRGIAKMAQDMGAVDSTSWNLISSCESADIVVLAIPFDQVQETLKAVGPELGPNCVVIDTSLLKQPVIAWAKEYLGENAHFVGIFLGTNPEFALSTSRGPKGAQAKLFSNAPCSIMPAPDCRPEAVKAAQDLAVLLGATPHFLDPAEYDGLSTAVIIMPGLLATAMLRSMTETASWREMRRLASPELAFSSHPLEMGAASLGQATALNRESVLYWLDSIMAEFGAIRAQVAEGQQDALAMQIEAIYQTREKWLADWERDRWENVSKPDMPTMGGFFGQLFGVRKRRRTDSSEGQ